MTKEQAGGLFFDDPSSAPGAGDFPGADAVILKDHTRVVLNADGRIVTTVRRALKMFSEWGRDRLSDEHIVFNAKFQDLKILACSTFAADGTRKDAPEVDRVVMTPWALEKAPWWADFQEAVVTNIGTEKGAVKVLEYEISDREPWRGPAWGREVFGEPYPVIEKIFALEVPKGAAVKYACFNGARKPEKSKGRAGDVYSWKALELPEFPQEDQPLTSWYLLPAAVWSAAGTWKEILASMGPRMAAAAAADDAISAWAAKALEGLGSEDQKILKIHSQLLSGVRKIEWPLASGGFMCRSAAEVFRSRYANPLEAAVLLKAALGAAGIQAVLAFASDSRVAVADFAFLGPEAEAWVEAGSQGLMLNAARGAEDCGPNHTAGRSFVKLGHRSAEEFKPRETPAEASAKVSVTLAADLSATGKARLSLRGRFNPFLGIQTSDDPEAAKKAAEGMAGKVFPKAALDKFDVAVMGPLLADLRLEIKAPAVKEAAADLYFIELPPAAKGFAGLDFALHRASRSTLLDLRGPFAATASVEIVLPAGFKVKALPRDMDFKSGAFRAKREWKAEESKIRLEETVAADSRYLEPGDYESFRGNVLGLENPAVNRIVLAKA